LFSHFCERESARILRLLLFFGNGEWLKTSLIANESLTRRKNATCFAYEQISTGVFGKRSLVVGDLNMEFFMQSQAQPERL
jgi:hypothetical protein